MNLTPEQRAALRAWAEAEAKAEVAKAVIAAEQAARKTCFETLGLPEVEGQQSLELPDGWKLKHKVPFKRDIDPRVAMHLRAPLAEHGVSLDSLIEWKPSLVTEAYRELTAEARAVFDACLTTTPGMPTLELVPPKVKP